MNSAFSRSGARVKAGEAARALGLDHESEAELAKQRNVCVQTSFPRIVNFFIKLLLLSGALEGRDGKVIERNVGAEASQVASLGQNATDRMESYLLEQILKKSDVKDREHWQLALALFRELDNSTRRGGGQAGPNRRSYRPPQGLLRSH